MMIGSLLVVTTLFQAPGPIVVVKKAEVVQNNVTPTYTLPYGYGKAGCGHCCAVPEKARAGNCACWNCPGAEFDPNAKPVELPKPVPPPKQIAQTPIIVKSAPPSFSTNIASANDVIKHCAEIGGKWKVRYELNTFGAFMIKQVECEQKD